jgi:hypothetical protein
MYQKHRNPKSKIQTMSVRDKLQRDQRTKNICARRKIGSSYVQNKNKHSCAQNEILETTWLEWKWVRHLTPWTDQWTFGNQTGTSSTPNRGACSSRSDGTADLFSPVTGNGEVDHGEFPTTGRSVASESKSGGQTFVLGWMTWWLGFRFGAPVFLIRPRRCEIWYQLEIGAKNDFICLRD